MNLRENIKKELRLITEQTQIANSKSVSFITCNGRTLGGVGSMTVNGQSPQVGDIVRADFCNQPVGNPGGSNIRTVFITAVNGPGNVTTSPSYGACGHVYGIGTTSGCPNCVAATANFPQYIPSGGCQNLTPVGTTTCICPTPCDTSTSSACAVQWWQNPNATWAATWINNRDCSNYTWPANNLETQALAIMATAPNPQPNFIYNNASDIWGAANVSGLVNPQKGQFIGKMAKSKFSQCQKVACNC